MMADSRSFCRIVGVGTQRIKLRDGTVAELHNVLFIPSLKFSLYSIIKHMSHLGCFFHAENNEYTLSFPSTVLYGSGGGPLFITYSHTDDDPDNSLTGSSLLTASVPPKALTTRPLSPTSVLDFVSPSVTHHNTQQQESNQTVPFVLSHGGTKLPAPQPGRISQFTVFVPSDCTIEPYSTIRIRSGSCPQACLVIFVALITSMMALCLQTTTSYRHIIHQRVGLKSSLQSPTTPGFH